MHNAANESPGCPLRKLHRKMADVHRLWHDAERYYFDPEAFLTYLDSCVQQLRGVTFVLQKYKSLFSDFDAWYGTRDIDGIWQARMRADEVMKWSVHVRNHALKEGDLEGTSIARLSLIDSYFERKPVDFEIDPFDDTASINKRVKEFIASSDADADFRFVNIERRWVEEHLPEWEVLDAIAYCYGILTELVDDAHRKIGLEPGQIGNHDGSVTEPVAEHGGRLPCMVAPAEARSMTIDLRTGKAFQIETLMRPLSDISPEQMSEHYGAEYVPQQGAADLETARLADIAEMFFNLGKRILVVDKHHLLQVILLGGPHRARFFRLDIDDQGDKFLMWRKVAIEVERGGFTTLIVIGETWRAHYDPRFPNRGAADAPDRTESLSLTAANREGEVISLSSPILRAPDGTITLGDQEQQRDVQVAFLAPVFRVWRKWDVARTGG